MAAHTFTFVSYSDLQAKLFQRALTLVSSMPLCCSLMFVVQSSLFLFAFSHLSTHSLFLDQLLQLFPEAYTKKLMELQDGIEPMPFELVEGVVRQELLDGAPLSDLFLTFDKEPLGAASIAQVHKATLLDGRIVAVKLQRPNVEPKLLGDVANLKRISKALSQALPVDYYTVFSELGEALGKLLGGHNHCSWLSYLKFAFVKLTK